MPTFVNTPPSTRLINFKNIEFTNSNLVSQISIIRTEGIQYDLDLVLNFDNLTFSDIEFKSKGYLLNLDQQLPSNLTISNSRFMNIKQGIINIASTKVENPDLLASVHLFNITAENIQENEASFLNVEQEGRLFVSDSSFKNMYIYQDGGVLSGGSSNTITVITNSTFENNSALNGGVFNVKEQSVIKIYSCNITRNFAITSGVINVVSNGQFEIYDSLIYNNHANKNPVSQLLDTAKTSVISNSKIYLNHAFSKASIISEFSSCSQLCFVNQNFRDYSSANFLSEMSETHNEYQFSLIFASLSMVSATEINQESLVVDSFVSTLEITDTVIRDFTMEAIAIRGVSSTISLRNLSFINFTVTDQVDYILDTLDSTLSIMNSTSIIFRARSSQVNIQGLTYGLIANAIELGVISSCYNSTISGLTSTLSEVLGRSLLRLESSQNISLSNAVLKNTQKSGVRILSSNMISITNMNVLNCQDGVYIESSTVELLQNSSFENNGNSSKINGGALHITNSDVTLSNNIFRQNTAHDGGAIAFTCTSTSLCSLAIPSSIFELNNATERGGSVYYDYKRPTFGQGIKYFKNSAQYGKNIASYAVKIVFEGTPSDVMKLEDLAPGITYDETLKFAVKDYDDQVMVLDSQNQISLTAANSTVAEMKGFNVQPLVNGIASFDNFIVHTNPGNQDVIITASSKAIDQAKISTVFGNPISNNTIEVDTRFCKPGERIVDNICNTCSAGTYSFAWNSTECSQCMDDAICSGGTEINVNPGYWRVSLNSTSVIECINKEACEGGYQNSKIQPTNCATGYQGNLCTKCSVTENDKYQAVGGFVCQKCPNPILNAIRVIFVGFAVFAYFMVLIIVNVRKTSESEISILLRILTNYVQIISLSLSFSTKYPSSLSDILVPAETVGSSSEAFLSFDCFVMDSEIKGPFPSSIFFKIFLLIWLPLIIFLFVALIWVLIYYIKPKWVPNLTRNLVISFVSIVFLLHPKFAQESMNLFRCVKIDEGIMKARIDTDIDCYSSEHGKWIAILGLPILVIWVTAMPLFALIVMYKKTRVGEESNVVRQYFLILYQGLRLKHFYWEFVNSLRKVCILISFTLPTSAQIMFALGVLLITWRLQDFLEPYKLRQNNEIEIFGINISIITLCCGLIFNQEKTLASLNNILLIIMVIFNILFIIKWLYLLFLTLGTKHAFFRKLAMLMRYIALQRKRDQFLSTEHSKDHTEQLSRIIKNKQFRKKFKRRQRRRKKLLPKGGMRMKLKMKEQASKSRMLRSE
ncbi:unnamed protein product [Moneuplotes crassus]|uniref:Uncharacterized protein n=1 Tax=Euplotes crassus TaxID=5936 RepID=A0AAD1XJG9_EUPCR|nr:unnamed protein product [Moneuplotes crassus]